MNDKEEGELKIQATSGLAVKENGEYENGRLKQARTARM